MEQRSGTPRHLVVQPISLSGVNEITNLGERAGKGEGVWSEAVARQGPWSSSQSSLPEEVKSEENETTQEQ